MLDNCLVYIGYLVCSNCRVYIRYISVYNYSGKFVEIYSFLLPPLRRRPPPEFSLRSPPLRPRPP